MTFQITDDERDVILKMREWQDGIPEEALGHNHGESAVYVSLISARAELCKLALRHGHNDVFERRDRMMKLISPYLLIELCKAWEDLKRREREEEFAEYEDDS